MPKVKEYNVGDMVELTNQLRIPRLKGIILQNLGYDRYLDDFVYSIYCFSFNPAKYIKWTHKTIKKIS